MIKEGDRLSMESPGKWGEGRGSLLWEGNSRAGSKGVRAQGVGRQTSEITERKLSGYRVAVQCSGQLRESLHLLKLVL